MEDKDLKRLEQEKKELNALINRGVSFEVKDVEFEERRSLFGLIRKRTPKEVTRTFKIEELTLATLDRLSSEWVELAIDEAKMKNADGLKAARRLAKEHSIRCARIVAIAVLGEDMYIQTPAKHGNRWVENSARLDELTTLFAHRIKPSLLQSLCTVVDTMCNLGDFLNSIRLMQTERTTMPIRIEPNNAG